MKHIKKFNESWIDSVKDFGREKFGIGQDKFEEELSQKMREVVDICNSEGYKLYDAGGELTDGHDVWTYKSSAPGSRGVTIICIFPDYFKGKIKVEWITSGGLIHTLDLKNQDVESLSDMLMRILDTAGLDS